MRLGARQIVRTPPGSAKITRDEFGKHGAPREYRSGNSCDRAAQEIGADYGRARQTEERPALASAKIPAGCAKKSYCRAAAKYDEAPRFLENPRSGHRARGFFAL